MIEKKQLFFKPITRKKTTKYLTLYCAFFVFSEPTKDETGESRFSDDGVETEIEVSPEVGRM